MKAYIYCCERCTVWRLVMFNHRLQMAIRNLLMAAFFLLVFMQGSASAQKDRMKLGETLNVKVSRPTKETRNVKVKETKPAEQEKLETKIERKAK